MRLKTRILDRLNARRHAVVDKGIHTPRIPRRDVLGDVKIPHFAGDLDREGGGIEARDPVDPGAAGQNILPGLLNGIAHRRNDAETCDDDSATCQFILLENRK